MKRFVSVLLCFLMIFVLVSCGKGDAENTDTTADTSSENTQNADFAFTSVNLEGEEVDNSIFEGHKLTMVNIWATFCSPCIREMPELQKLSEDYEDKDVQIVGIVCDVNINSDGSYSEDLLDKAKSIVDEAGVKYTNILPSESLNEIKLNEVYSVPETIFVDENGNIVGQSYVGSKSYDQWAEIIDYTLKTMEE